MRSLFRKADRPRRAAATPVAHAVVRQDAVTVGKRRLVQERPEPFDAGAVVYEHHRFSGSAYVVLELDALKSCPIHPTGSDVVTRC
jgi:hypothetical protein